MHIRSPTAHLQQVYIPTHPMAPPELERALEADLSFSPEFSRFREAAKSGNLVPLYERVFSDQLTPVSAYRCLVRADDREAPSFLFESVINGTQQGRYSFVGAHPSLEIVAHANAVTVLDNEAGTTRSFEAPDPLQAREWMCSPWSPVIPEGLPPVFTGGWVGYAGYDTVRYVYPAKLPFSAAPPDDRGLPDLHLALYNDVIVFDHATKLAYVIAWVHLGAHASPEAAFLAGRERLAATAAAIRSENAPAMLGARVNMSLGQRPALSAATSNMTKAQFMAAVERTKEHIQAGDVFQLVGSQRFERRTFADPFEIYRQGGSGGKVGWVDGGGRGSLRVVNPSPYMTYLQARGCILVASSPEILCRVGLDGTVTNRPLAGTRPRGATQEADEALEADLLADEKELAEHIMLVDLGRNDVGRVARHGSVKVEALMEVERYSHVMHISSTVTGRLRPGLNAWDALRAALPVGTISGAPKVRAMQIIDELEVTRRGPYGGGLGHVSFAGGLDMALALRTMSGAGFVADSDPEKEWEETVNKAAGLGRAIDLAEQAFVGQAGREQEG
ncbi:Anthranilate synthase component I-1, chloroplastic [Auxenochlorella protothecoides]|uniref:Anthranilate synthase component I-1, chloroplastic n=1 Tax=Auxenochlorella protothecoides TaxID=3075 RepID=A0A087SMH5_AUXPR|nr:Anthranilate synthase component I-1, chloroplastic [Auxenochlorella protothecoides]KFM26929.1 Anthranilate synthase component I-1, chloroplastic [Auxenochlorella protothecoides]